MTGKTDAFGGPAANSNRRGRLLSSRILLAIGSGLSFAAVVGLGVLGIGVVRMVDSHRPVSMMPVIAAEAPGHTEATVEEIRTWQRASCPPSTAAFAADAPRVDEAAYEKAQIAQLQLQAVAPVNEAAARAQLTAWWAAAHVPRPHVSHPQHPIRLAPRFPDLTQANAPATRDYGCPASLGAACQ